MFGLDRLVERTTSQVFQTVTKPMSEAVKQVLQSQDIYYNRPTVQRKFVPAPSVQNIDTTRPVNKQGPSPVTNLAMGPQGKIIPMQTAHTEQENPIADIFSNISNQIQDWYDDEKTRPIVIAGGSILAYALIRKIF